MKNLLYYAFDWDDNIMSMPTEIMVKCESGKEIGVSTVDFAKYRSLIGNEEFTYKGEIVIGYPSRSDDSPGSDLTDSIWDRTYGAFRNFGDLADPNMFIKDVCKAIAGGKFSPSWNDFIECLVNGCLFAIITARGHESETLKSGVKYILDNLLSDEQKQTMYNNLLVFKDMYNEVYPEIPRILDLDEKFSENTIVLDYLNLCDFVGVSAPSREGSSQSPEAAKRSALLDFKIKVNNYAEMVGKKAMIGFSDDDPGNVKNIQDLFENINRSDFSNITKFIVKNTHGGLIEKSVY